LWADISVICEEKASHELAVLASGSFWEGGQEVVEKDVVEMRSSFAPQLEKDWETGVSRTLESLKDVAVVDGCVNFISGLSV